jgi:glutamine amidotransferase
LHEDGPVEANASTSKGYEKVYGNIKKERMNGIFLSHLRKASSGKKVRENTPPFIEDDWVFSHNGNIYGLGNEQFSDSRIFFKMLVEKIDETRDLQKGIYEVVNKIKENYKYDSLTFLLSNNNTLCAYRDFAKEDDYYTIKYTITKDSTLILVQEEIWNLNWNTVPNESLIIVNNDLRILGPLKI